MQKLALAVTLLVVSASAAAWSSGTDYQWIRQWINWLIS